MKRYIIFWLILLFNSTGGATPLLDNGSGSEDSLSISVMVTDSLGNPADLSADSFYVSVIGPSGDSILTLAGIAASTGLHIDSITTTLGGKRYIFSEAIANLDGIGSSGMYEVTFCAKDNNPLFINCRTVMFQLIDHSLQTSLSAVLEMLDSLKSQDNWIAKEYTVASLDSTFVARSVWNSPQVNHVNTGTFGDYLDADITGLGTGSGIYSYTVVVYDSLSGHTIPGAGVVVRNEAQTSLIALGKTTVDGSLTLNLNSGTYTLLSSAPGYIFPAYDTISITSSTEDTVMGYAFSPEAPTDPSLTRVYGYIYDISGQPENLAEITISLPEGVAVYDGKIISPFHVTTMTDSTGYFYIDVIPTDSLTPAGQQYEVSVIRVNGAVLRKKLYIPALPHWQLSW